MRLYPISSSSEDSPMEQSRAMLYLNVYDLTPVNDYLYWVGLGIFHSGIEGKYRLQSMIEPVLAFDLLTKNLYCIVHGLEYGFGAHEYPTSGVFEVEPKSCPGFIFRRSILLGSTEMTRSEVRSFMDHLSNKYYGDTYHLISKNCNHFTDEVCQRLTGKPIPGWVNRLARVGSFCSCLLPEALQDAPIGHVPEYQMYSEDRSDSSAASCDLEDHHHLLVKPNTDVAFLADTPVRLAKDVL